MALCAHHKSMLDAWQHLSQQGQLAEMAGQIDAAIQSQNPTADFLRAVAQFCLAHGLLTLGAAAEQQAQLLEPNPLVWGLRRAQIAHESGHHALCDEIYADLLKEFDTHPVVWRNYLMHLQYAPSATTDTQLEKALVWAKQLENDPLPQREFAPRRPGDPLRVGYVSADFCQHVVGWLFTHVLAQHDPAKVTVFAYNVSEVQDRLTREVKAHSRFRHAFFMSDDQLFNQIKQDQIDVLVDLSGHTAGSRLTVFARRPAPVQISWLGYFATTGLRCIDAVLLDRTHVPEQPDDQQTFVETVHYLSSRLCFREPSFAPAVVQANALRPVTFGSFNNTAKLNPAVIELWASVLEAVPHSRLVLKWRTFNDARLRVQVLDAFTSHGVDGGRIELRGPSVHKVVLAQYADIDIALDPFPFSGGMTTCEALWMGVPVVTWPQRSAVSRQSAAILQAIGLPELIVGSANDYLQKAVELARAPDWRRTLRSTLRSRMRSSVLMDARRQAHELETIYESLYQQKLLAAGVKAADR